MSASAFLIGPGGQVTKLQGLRGTTPDCPQAKFQPNEIVRIRRMRHLRHLPEIGAIAAVIPPGFSPDHAWDDLHGRPRRLMCQVPDKAVTYLVAFEGGPNPHILREKYLFHPSGNRS